MITIAELCEKRGISRSSISIMKKRGTLPSHIFIQEKSQSVVLVDEHYIQRLEEFKIKQKRYMQDFYHYYTLTHRPYHLAKELHKQFGRSVGGWTQFMVSDLMSANVKVFDIKLTKKEVEFLKYCRRKHIEINKNLGFKLNIKKEIDEFYK
jgi:predicted DNA-binding transcriptional regulator AlpA